MSEILSADSSDDAREAGKAAELLRVGAITQEEYERLLKAPVTGAADLGVSVARFAPTPPDPLVYVLGAQAPKLWWLVTLVGVWSVLAPWWLLGEIPSRVELLAGIPLAIGLAAFALADGAVFACSTSVPPKRLATFAAGALLTFIVIQLLLVAIAGSGVPTSDFVLRMLAIGTAQLAAAFVAGRIAGPRYVESGWKYSVWKGAGTSVVVALTMWLVPSLLPSGQQSALMLVLDAPYWVAMVIASVAFSRSVAESRLVPVQAMRGGAALRSQGGRS